MRFAVGHPVHGRIVAETTQKDKYRFITNIINPLVADHIYLVTSAKCDGLIDMPPQSNG